MTAVKMCEREAKWIQLLDSTVLPKKEISARYGFKYMDVVNVLRGNSFSNVTGILNKNIGQAEYYVVKYLLKTGKSYRVVADFTGIDANKVRNIMGVLQFKRDLSI